MMQTTDTLIAELAGDLKPVKRMAPPAKRMLGWVMIALPVSLILGAFLEDQHLTLALERVQDPRIVVELVAIFATALSAGYAALASAQPGRNKKLWMLPIGPFLVWLSLIGESCFRLYERIGPDQFSFAPLWTCYPAIAVTGFAPAIVLVVLLRRGMMAQPTASVALGTLAAAALGAVGLRLYHQPDATAMLLMWQLIATISLMGGASLISALVRRFQ